jgi:lipoprotein-releasing system ATP-binding protein
MPVPLLEFRGVSKAFAVGDTRVPVLRDASFALHAGERVAILGPSGSGKSTVLNLAGALDQPDQGSVLLGGDDLSRQDGPTLARFRNERLGFVFQAHHLLPHCSVLENVLVPALAQKSRVPADVTKRARQLIERVGLRDREQHLPGRLSGGERQRAAVVRALINEPSLVLADEPTGALDRASAQEIGRLLVELNREQGMTLLVVTHSAELASLMDRVLEMRDGNLVARAPQIAG